MSKWPKIAVLGALLIGAGYFFGTTCSRIGEGYELILAPSQEVLPLLARFLLAVAGVAVSAGLVVALARPVWLALVAFGLSGLAVLVGWQITLVSGALALTYVVAGSLYAVAAARELNERIGFSARCLDAGRSVLLMSLAAVACGSLGMGYGAYIQREGFSVPEVYLDAFVERAEAQIEAEVPAEDRDEALTRFKEEFRNSVDGFVERRVRPHERLIPLAVAAGVFTPLVTVTNLLAWAPTLILALSFRVLIETGAVRIVSETRDVDRLVL
ncbi:MAG: hypothetical protein PVH50_11100 [Anaerolineae bacterium]|jgi:hypothetical protein